MPLTVEARVEVVGGAEAALDFIAQAARALVLHAPWEGEVRFDGFFNIVRVELPENFGELGNVVELVCRIIVVQRSTVELPLQFLLFLFAPRVHRNYLEPFFGKLVAQRRRMAVAIHRVYDPLPDSLSPAQLYP